MNMKLTSDQWRVTSDEKNPAADGGASGHSSLVTRHSQNGIALVITLILISVTLIMAVAFLAISRRERGSVATSTDTANARLAAEAALASDEAQIVANALTQVAATNSPAIYGLLVSTNYINGSGFQTGSPNPTNVNYYLPDGTPVAGNDFLLNVSNLFYLPRLPVYMSNTVTHAVENRYYLDLNRNGYPETNGLVPNLSYNSSGQLVPDGTTSFQTGDPEWVGILSRPDVPHGPQNQALSRYAFIAVPAGNTLDLNAIHDQTATATVNNPASTYYPPDGYLRNEGIGSWELNLAAFFTDLNTNEWDTAADPYAYQQWNGLQNTGRGFEDALSLLSYRYDYNYYNQAVPSVFGYTALNNNGFGNVDGYTHGFLMTNTVLPLVSPVANTVPWAGSDNTNRYFTLDELFNPAETSIKFTNAIISAGSSNATYDRYTFYRMLDQLGSDSTPESGLMNLNYDNLTVTNGSASVTNYLAWTPLNFFTNAADRLLKDCTAFWATNYVPTNNYALYPNGWAPVLNPYFTNTFGAGIAPFGVANIPVVVNGQFVYQASVQRLLQLAANLYDSSTNSYYPSVFRPVFSHDTFGNLYIVNFQQIVSVSPNVMIPASTFFPPLQTPLDVSAVTNLGSANTAIYRNVYGVPWIIGAKKGFPSFNKLALEDTIQISRKLEVVSSTPGGKTFNNSAVFTATNMMWVFGINTSIGVDCWNPYTNAYVSPNNFTISTVDTLSMSLMATGGVSSYTLVSSNSMIPPVTFNYSAPFTWPGSTWSGSDALNPTAPSPFFIPLYYTNITFLPSSFYNFPTPQMVPQSIAGIPAGSPIGWQGPKINVVPLATPLPQMVLNTTNHLQLYMLDGTHVIDYVQFSGPNNARNLNPVYENNTNTTVYYPNWWSTNLVPKSFFKGVPAGIASQIDVSETSYGGNQAYWGNNLNAWNIAQEQIDGFAPFMGFPAPYGAYVNSQIAQNYQTNYAAQVPYTPGVTIVDYTSWEANDPLVHYTTNDLYFQDDGTRSGIQSGIVTVPQNNQVNTYPQIPDIGKLSQRFAPWGVVGQTASGIDTNQNNISYKDPLLFGSDDWDFPTNKYPTVGWVGRVHRGTPWQTVFLKATNLLAMYNPGVNSQAPYVGMPTWAHLTGNQNYFDATNTLPVEDRLLFDLFTTSPSDDATRGQLSVNQPHLAAWSALFSGMIVPTNSTGGYTVIPPAGANYTNIIYRSSSPSAFNDYYVATNPLAALWGGIQQKRAVFQNADGLAGAFERKGDILSVPELTERSPFLDQVNNSYNDEQYEWLPQQALSLLRANGNTQRYVIYCYGQALRPAGSSGVVQGGTYFGLVTNYQVTAESAARAVVRVEGANTGSPHVVVESFNPLPPP
jgi:hypothetical protein